VLQLQFGNKLVFVGVSVHAKLADLKHLEEKLLLVLLVSLLVS